MRGYDQVSFVFGLEVTWSLIQQRQQEEEEKQAMLELEKMEEIEAAFESYDAQPKGHDQEEEVQDEGDDEDNVEETPESSINADAENTEIEDDGDQIDGDEGICTDAPDEKPEIEEATDIAAVDSFDVAVDSAEVDQMDLSDIKDVAELDLAVSEEANAQTDDVVQNEPEVESKPPADTWDCAQCTFANKMSRKTCEMCKFKGNPKRRKS